MLSVNSILARKKAVLVLPNGLIMHGYGFGAVGRAEGEFVFTTFTAAGYNCALTDPSNKAQLYILTYPLVGNYGVPNWSNESEKIDHNFESRSIQCSGFIIQDLCKNPSHYESEKNLDTFLYEEGIPGIYGIDTRYLTQILRNDGVQSGFIQVFKKNEPIPSDEKLLEICREIKDPNSRHLVQEVSTRNTTYFKCSNSIGRIIIVDCGVKNNIIRYLLKKNLEVILVPYNIDYHNLMDLKPDGVILSNGPGDPKKCQETISLTKNLLNANIPTMGICLGHQILCLALGGDTFKLKYGHRGGNKPVIDLRTNRVYITSQNHGYCVQEESLENTGFFPMFRNADDNTNEGIYHPNKPIFSVQFHPEACPGPEDTSFLFIEFIQKIALHNFLQSKKKKQEVNE